MDYQTYAYLQTGQDAAARALVDGAAGDRGAPRRPAIGVGRAAGSAGVFALAAIPAR